MTTKTDEYLGCTAAGASPAKRASLLAIESAVMSLDGVDACEATEDIEQNCINVSIFEGTADPGDVVEAVRDLVPAGVGIRLRFSRVLPGLIEAVEVRGELAI